MKSIPPVHGTEDAMATMTLEQLRARAKALGLKGYSKLKKAALERLLMQAEPATNNRRAPASAPPKAPAAARMPAPTQPPSHPEPETRLTPYAPPAESAEERIETAKYAVVAPGMALGARRLGDLDEDIERLPALRNPQLALLPQKPGVLHASWALPAGFGVPVERLRLRLCRLESEDVAVLEEIALPAARGQWYFHVPLEPALGLYGVHLGYYHGGGFVSAMHDAVARIPALYASSALDRRWRVSESQFRAMYLRAGGVLRTGHLAWTGSVSSPGPRPPGAERLAWPGGVSSRS